MTYGEYNITADSDFYLCRRSVGTWVFSEDEDTVTLSLCIHEKSN